MSAPSPAISIVIATYNRSAALRCALASVVGQTFADWEALVVGDLCTDDTAAVVESFADPRIRFENLPINIGEQSGPNNVGIERTTAPVVAFLNHDDLWFRDHLQISLAVMQARQADLVFSPNLNILRGADRDDPFTVIVDGLARNGKYDPRPIDRATVASSWLVRRDALVRLRGWKASTECRIEPSQDLLLRAHRLGMRMWSTGTPSLISIPSGTRHGSYLGNTASEQEQFLARLDEPTLRAELLGRDSTAHSPDIASHGTRRDRVWRASLRRLDRVGISPRVVHYTINRRLRPGQLLDQLRIKRGLDAKGSVGSSTAGMRRQAVLDVCTSPTDGFIDFAACRAGARYTAAGWSAPEPWGVWNDGTRAELALRVADADDRTPSSRLALRVVAHCDAEHPAQRVGVVVDGRRSSLLLQGHGPHDVDIDLGSLTARPTIIAFDLPDAWVPNTADGRRLGIGLLSATIETAVSAAGLGVTS